MITLQRAASPRRFILALAVLALAAAMLAGALAWGGIQTVTDDYGISIVPLAQDCGPYAVWDSQTNQCVPLGIGDD